MADSRRHFVRGFLVLAALGLAGLALWLAYGPDDGTTGWYSSPYVPGQIPLGYGVAGREN